MLPTRGRCFPEVFSIPASQRPDLGHIPFPESWLQPQATQSSCHIEDGVNFPWCKGTVLRRHGPLTTGRFCQEGSRSWGQGQGWRHCYKPQGGTMVQFMTFALYDAVRALCIHQKLYFQFRFGSFPAQVIHGKIFSCESGQQKLQLLVSHVITAVNNRHSGNPAVLTWPSCFPLSVHYSINYRRYLTIQYKIDGVR